MDRVAHQLRELAPALAFLAAGVPLATLLDRLGFFESLASVLVGLAHRAGRGTSVGALWLLAALTTVVLNLDTTIVLLTPLYLRLARRTGGDQVGLALVPLLLAGLASSVLPVSNLTTLVAAEHYSLSTGDVVAHLAAPSAAAVAVGWVAYRRRRPTRLPVAEPGPVDAGALRIGATVIAGLLVGFVIGPGIGIAPWITALVADAVLVVVTRHLPWRDVPVGTAALVAAIASFVALVVPTRLSSDLGSHSGVGAVATIAVIGAVAAGVVNNLPALLASFGPAGRAGWSAWAWLVGVNVGAVLLPLGALANLLWMRIMRTEGVPVEWRRYPTLVVPIALPAFVAAVAVLVLERAVSG